MKLAKHFKTIFLSLLLLIVINTDAEVWAVSQKVSVSQTNNAVCRETGNSIVVTWTSATGGTVSQEIAAALEQTYAIDIPILYGLLLGVVTNPGSTAPTDDWDLTLVDSDGVDVLSGLGANRDTSTSESVAIPSPIPVIGTLTLTIANAGDEKTGTVRLQFSPF